MQVSSNILQSSKKSIDGLDSSGDFLDDTEDVFEEEEKRKEVCDNIVMKFLELTAEKSNNPSSVQLEIKGGLSLTPAPVFQFQSETPNNPSESPARPESRGVATAVPFFNLRANFQKYSNNIKKYSNRSLSNLATPNSAISGLSDRDRRSVV